jgi:nicotinamide riboside transporter PnuC
VIGLDWIAGFLGIWSKWLVGNKNKNGWIINFFAGFVWIGIIYEDRRWGLVLPTVLHSYVAVRNYFMWRRQERQSGSGLVYNQDSD